MIHYIFYKTNNIPDELFAYAYVGKRFTYRNITDHILLINASLYFSNMDLISARII